jgi:uncharacterized membrane protein YeaQ/YmgE (transglycosylase-associated protein family)
MGLIASIIIGLIAGAIAGRIMGSNYPWYIDLGLGLVGAAVGGWLGSLMLGVDLTTGFNITSLIVSIIGAVIVIAAYRLITKRPLRK